MSSRMILRISSVLLLIVAFSSAVLIWHSWQIFTDLQTGIHHLGTGFYSIISFGTSILMCLGLLALSVQSRHKRHWLGWSGIVFALCGFIAQSITSLTYVAASSPLPSPSLVTKLGNSESLAIAIGMVLWAMDLPSTKNITLIQKAMMGLIGLEPLIRLEISFIFTNYLAGTQITPYYLVLGAFEFTAWFLLSISIWFYQETLPTIAQQLVP
jgi:hypothetical protein